MFLHGFLINDRYRVIKLVDSGAQGMVFKAADEQRNGRLVAIKVLMATSPGSLERFSREMLIHSKQQSPHVLPIYETGAFEMDGKMYPFCVFPYIAGGKTLSHMFEEYRRMYVSDEPIQVSMVPLPKLLELMIQAGTGLRDAHRKDVTHRDFKPGNVLVYRDAGGHECAMVMDFGISKIVRENEQLSSEKLTQLALGTPEYMAPQQGFAPVEDPKLDAQRQDKRNDIYSYGITMYEGVTGHNPFPFEKSRFEIWGAVVRHELQPDSISKYCKDTPSELVDLIMSCIEHDIDKRPRDMDEVLETLTRIRFDLPSKSSMDSDYPIGIGSSQSEVEVEVGHAETVYMPSTPPSGFPPPPQLPNIIVAEDEPAQRTVPPRRRSRPARISIKQIETRNRRFPAFAVAMLVFLLGIAAALYIVHPLWLFPGAVPTASAPEPAPLAVVPSAVPVQPSDTASASAATAKPRATTSVIILSPPPVSAKTEPPPVASPVVTPPRYIPPGNVPRQTGTAPPIEPEGPIDPGPPM